MSPAKLLIVAGAVLIAVGLLWLLGARVGLGRLPGDFLWQLGDTRIFLPLGTSLVISVVLTLALWLIGRW